MADQTFFEFCDANPDIAEPHLASQDDAGTMWASIRASEPSFLRWILASPLTDTQRAQIDGRTISDTIELGAGFMTLYADTKRRDLPESAIDALITGITGEFKVASVCTGCRSGDPVDQFIMSCISTANEGTTGCANCIAKGQADTCDVQTPVAVCLDLNCPITTIGHEHLVRQYLEDHFQAHTSLDIQDIMAKPWSSSVWLKRSYYYDLLRRIMEGREIGDNIRHSLLAVAHEQDGQKWCYACMDRAQATDSPEIGNPYVYCAANATHFKNDGCANCIYYGTDCLRAAEDDDEMDENMDFGDAESEADEFWNLTEEEQANL